MLLPSFTKSVIRLLLGLNLILIVSLLLAYLSPYISPAIFWPIAFFGLGFPVIVIANVAIILLWLLLRPRLAILSLLTLMVGIKPLSRQWQWNNSSVKDLENSLTIVSFNVHDFSGLVDGAQKTSTRKEIFNFLRKTKSQIICLQDMPYFFPDQSRVLPKLSKDLGMKYFYPHSTDFGNGHEFSGISMLTSYPIVHSGEIHDDHHSFAIYSDLVIDYDTIRVYSIHLASTKLEYVKELLTIKGIAESGKRSLPRRIIRIIKRLKSAFISRANQAGILRSSIAGSPYPVIICGDHNDTPLSYALHTIKKGLTDSFIARGKGFGQTYGGSSIPLRIDYIMASTYFMIETHETVKTGLSDHLPVIVKVVQKGKRL